MRERKRSVLSKHGSSPPANLESLSLLFELSSSSSWRETVLDEREKIDRESVCVDVWGKRREQKKSTKSKEKWDCEVKSA